VARRDPFLHQRGDVFYFFWVDEAGKRHEESLRTTDVDIAKQQYGVRMREIETGRSPNDMRGWSLQKAGAFWLDHRKPRVSQGTLKAESSVVRNLVRIFGGDVTLISLADIRRIRSYQDARLKANISSKTVNNEIQVLASILQLAELWQRIGHRYKPLRVVQSDLPDALTQEESIRLLTAAANSSPHAVAPYAAALAFATGMRSGEIKGIRLGDLHHESTHPFLHVRRATTKTDAGARRVVLDRIALWAVRRLVARAHLLGCRSPEDYLLPTDRARHTRPTDPLHGASGYDPAHPQASWETEWQKFRSVVGIDHRRFHDFRHTYISRAAEAGVPVAVIQAQVGHLSGQMVAWYTHISERAQFKAAQQIEDNSPELPRILGLSAPESVIAITETAKQSGITATVSSGGDSVHQSRVATPRCRRMHSTPVRVPVRR
jgi:integrase